MRKLFLLCAACLLVLAGCTNDPEHGSSTPAPDAGTVTPVDTPTAAPSAPTTALPVESTPLVSPTAAPATDTAVLPEPSPDVSQSPLPEETFDPDALTLDDFPTQLITSGTAVLEGTEPLYLIAQIPDHDTWLYGLSGGYGLILRVGTQWKNLDLGYLTPRAVLPAMAYGDFDGDLELELALLVYTDSGTGVSIWDLHIIEFESETLWTDCWFAPPDYQAILSQIVTYTHDPSVGGVTIAAGESRRFQPDPALQQDGLTPGAFQTGQCGDSIVSFSVSGDAIRADFGVSLFYENIVPSVEAGSVQADVIFTGSAFGLANFMVVADAPA